ncbi:hypothetical protein D9M70_468520 [compost metagenome]
MLGLRWRIEATPRTKKGQPAHRVTGVASTSSTQFWVAPCSNCIWCAVMASKVTITVKGRVHQKRRVKSLSSGFSSSSSSGITGSKAMPQIGQLPGPDWRICGCIGQVYSATPAPAAGATAG